MTQIFTEDGRVPVTPIKLGPCVVTQVKTTEKDGYDSIQLGFGSKNFKNVTKPMKGHLKGANLKKAPLVLLEVEVSEESNLKVGDTVSIADIFAKGDTVRVKATTKGKGFAGVVKRWGFGGAPRSHGHGGILRKGGSIGQGTTPGRVWKGKMMPGRMGNDSQTVTNLKVVDVNADSDIVFVRGSVPGGIGSHILVTRTSEKQEVAQEENQSETEAKEE